MREVIVEFTMTLPSEEHISIYENLAEDGVLGEYFQNLFLQACSAAKNENNGLGNKEDVDSIKRQLEVLTSTITTLLSNGVVANVPAPAGNVEEVQKPVEKPKPKTTPKKKVAKGMGGKGNFMANAMSKSKAMNSTRRDG